MTGATGQESVPTGIEGSIEFQLAAKVENLAVLRTVVSAVATFEDLDFDAVADLRLAVDEACTQLVRSAVPDSALVVRIDPGEDAVAIHASATCQIANGAIVAPGSFSWHVLSSLTDDVQTFADGPRTEAGRVVGISLTARRARLPG